MIIIIIFFFLLLFFLFIFFIYYFFLIFFFIYLSRDNLSTFHICILIFTNLKCFRSITIYCIVYECCRLCVCVVYRCAGRSATFAGPCRTSSTCSSSSSLVFSSLVFLLSSCLVKGKLLTKYRHEKNC